MMDDYQKYIALSRYARWLPDEKRRETWAETVQRYTDYFLPSDPSCYGGSDSLPDMVGSVRDAIYRSILDLETMPSMRSLMTAGKPLDRDNVAGYNCAYVSVDRVRVFDEIMYILMCGTGVGFSAEVKYTENLPTISEDFFDTDTVIHVPDSKIGWSKSFKELISLLYQGQVPKWDMSKVRPAGSPLKTFGGRASGPEPLEDLFKYSVNTFRRFAGKKLPPIAVHDLVCKVAEIVVVGGVRRSALISLSDMDDPCLRKAKSPYKALEYMLLGHTDKGDRKYSVTVDDSPYGRRSLIIDLGDWDSEKLQRDNLVEWYHVHPERSLANNSIAYERKPSPVEFLTEWSSLIESNSGERGIYNREAACNLIPERRKEFGYKDYGCNPCSEIVLRSMQFCNLTEVVLRPEDTFGDIKRKVEHCTILGTLQATKTNFRYLSTEWKKNTEEEALLGVSFTGIEDHPVMNGRSSQHDLNLWLEELKQHAIKVNRDWAEALGIRPSAAITCVKPSGTVSQLVNASSGIHPRYAPYYIRTVRADKKDPLTRMMVDAGFPVEDNKMNPESGVVFSFPIKSPEVSVFRDDRSAIDQLKLWKTYQLYWCEHKPSITVYVKPDEWIEVGAWVDKNFQYVSGISFLPHSDHSYDQAPYQEITKEEYEEWLTRMPPEFDISKLGEYELEDTTSSMKEFACTGNSCELT